MSLIYVLYLDSQGNWAPILGGMPGLEFTGRV